MARLSSDVLLTWGCLHCGPALIKKGRWFKAVAAFICAGCHREVRIAYNDKVDLFAKNAHLASCPG
jgi:hypothetical protein